MPKSAVLTLPRVESRSNSLRWLVVHSYKSHHQLSEHPQPPLLYQIDGEMEEKSMASSPERANSVMFGSLMLPTLTLPLLREIESLSLNKLTDVNGLESLESIRRAVSISRLSVRGYQFKPSKEHRGTAGKDHSDQAQFKLDDSWPANPLASFYCR